MKKVMVRAWEIAREGVTKFGGKVKEYFAQALAIAWEELKTERGSMGSPKKVTNIEEMTKVLAEAERVGEDSYKLNAWVKRGMERIYVNYITGSGYRKYEGFFELSNGKIIGTDNGNQRSGIKAVIRKFEGYEVEEIKEILKKQLEDKQGGI